MPGSAAFPGLRRQRYRPRYSALPHLQNGVLTEETTDVMRYFEERKDLVSFLIGCSFSFEAALLEADIPVRQIEEGRQCADVLTQISPASLQGDSAARWWSACGPFLCKDTGGGCYYGRDARVHGAPVQIGAPEAIGITDLAHPITVTP